MSYPEQIQACFSERVALGNAQREWRLNQSVAAILAELDLQLHLAEAHRDEALRDSGSEE